MKITLFAVLIALVLGMGPAAAAQGSADVADGVPSSDRQVLLDHGITLTKPALTEALHNPDAGIRWVAAFELAAFGRDTIPVIAGAFAKEQDSTARLQFAFILARFGEKSGTDALRQMCGGSDTRIKISAAQYLLDLKEESCLENVLTAWSESRISSEARIQVLNLLPRFKNISDKDSERIFSLIVSSLADGQQPAVRLAAGNALVDLGNPDSIPYFQTAIGRERDETVRSGLENSLHQLQKKITAAKEKGD